MDKATIELLARRAGLAKALAEFPDDVAAAAKQAADVMSKIKAADRSGAPSRGRRCARGGAMRDGPVGELHWLSAAEAAQAIADKELSPVELMKALLERIATLDPRLNAFIRLDARGRHGGGQGGRSGSHRRAACAGRCMACRSASRTSSTSPACPRPAIPRSSTATSPRPTRSACRSCAAPAPSSWASSRRTSSPSAGRASTCRGRRRAIPGTPTIIPAARRRARARAWRRACSRWRSAPTPAAACAIPRAAAASSG